MDAVFDVATRTLTLTDDEVSPFGCDLSARLNHHGQTIPLRGVSFGFSLTIDGTLADKQAWPPEGTRYVKTDQDVLATYRLSWQPSQSVSVQAWLVDATGQRHEATRSFVAPELPEPGPDLPDPQPEPELP